MPTDDSADPGRTPPPRTGRRFVVAFLAVVVALAVLGVAGAVVIADGAEDDGETEVEVPLGVLRGAGAATPGCREARGRPLPMAPDAPAPTATSAACGPVVPGATPTNTRR